MDRNVKLYSAASYMVAAAKQLTGIEDEIRAKLLLDAETLLSKIVVDESEIEKIEEYRRIIRDE